MNLPTCPCCGKLATTRHGVPTDITFEVPDAGPDQDRLRFNTRDFLADMAVVLDDVRQLRRAFIRCILPFRSSDRADEWAIGCWIEVDLGTFTSYATAFRDGTGHPGLTGVLANEIWTFPDSLGLAVKASSSTRRTRPRLKAVTPGPLLEAQRSLPRERWTQIVLAGMPTEGAVE